MENQPQAQTQHSRPPKIGPPMFAGIMARLASATRCRAFTETDLEVWFQYLGCYSAEIMSAAVDRFCLADDPFPSVGKLRSLCVRIQQDAQAEATPGQLRIEGQRERTREPINYRAIRAAKQAEREAAGPADVEAVKLAERLEWNE
jgi:hypothetical protein